MTGSDGWIGVLATATVRLPSASLMGGVPGSNFAHSVSGLAPDWRIRVLKLKPGSWDDPGLKHP